MPEDALDEYKCDRNCAIKNARQAEGCTGDSGIHGVVGQRLSGLLLTRRDVENYPSLSLVFPTPQPSYGPQVTLGNRIVSGLDRRVM